MRCPRCGSPDAVGGRYVRREVSHTAVLACGCGRGEGGLAAVRSFTRSTQLQEWGRLGADGRWEVEHVEAVETETQAEEEEQVRTEVRCPTCVAAAAGADWTVTAGEPHEDRLGQCPFVACQGCGAEHLVG